MRPALRRLLDVLEGGGCMKQAADGSEAQSRAEPEEGNEGDRRKKGLETSMHPIDPRSAIHLISNVLLLRLLLYARDEESS